jgi:hypothetical protein
VWTTSCIQPQPANPSDPEINRVKVGRGSKRSGKVNGAAREWETHGGRKPDRPIARCSNKISFFPSTGESGLESTARAGRVQERVQGGRGERSGVGGPLGSFMGEDMSK